jgi:hypothetical protein
MPIKPEQLKGEHGICDTVKVKADNEQGFVLINEHDFDKTKQELFKEPVAVERKGSKG